MTPAQITRIQAKIIKLRKILAAEQARFGGYNDSAFWRYSILNLYVSIGDYKGAAVYFRWFFKNFPDDSGFSFLLGRGMHDLFLQQQIRAGTFHGFHCVYC